MTAARKPYVKPTLVKLEPLSPVPAPVAPVTTALSWAGAIALGAGFMAGTSLLTIGALMLTGRAEARTVHMTLDHCMVTWGTFCPVESLGGTLLIVGAFAAFGIAKAAIFRPKQPPSTGQPRPAFADAVTALVHAGDYDGARAILAKWSGHPQAAHWLDMLNVHEREHAKEASSK